ncbi:hypothetical protein V3C99_015222 [Haemonchus contortus]
MLWARAADWYLGSIEHVNEGLRDEFKRWFHFAISCPAEGGRAFDSIRNALRARNYTLAAHLISVLATFAQDLKPTDRSGITNPPLCQNSHHLCSTSAGKWYTND